MYGSLSEHPTSSERGSGPLPSPFPALAPTFPFPSSGLYLPLSQLWPCLSLGWQPEQGAKLGVSSSKAAEG